MRPFSVAVPASGSPSKAQRQTATLLHDNSSHHQWPQEAAPQIHQKRLTHLCWPPSPARILNQISRHMGIPYRFRPLEKRSNCVFMLHAVQFHGLMSRTPVLWKSATLRVTTVNP
jgi:hypothetical protein